MTEPTSWITILLVGLIVGALASRLVHGRGQGCLVDTIVGVAGSFIGGLVLRLVVPPGTVIISPTVDYIVTGFLGAVLLLGIVRLVQGRDRH